MSAVLGVLAFLSSWAHRIMWAWSRYNENTDSVSPELKYHALVINTESRAKLPGLLKTEEPLTQTPAQLPFNLRVEIRTSAKLLHTPDAAARNSHATGRFWG